MRKGIQLLIQMLMELEAEEPPAYSLDGIHPSPHHREPRPLSGQRLWDTARQRMRARRGH